MAHCHRYYVIFFVIFEHPALGAATLTGTFGMRLVLGWAPGLTASIIGLWLSFIADLPVGVTVASLLGLLPILTVLLNYVIRRSIKIKTY